ncbi:MAG TPA: aromatic ring-hydroxylating dioxygenase subunit alpha [Candidatus Baltobacteraceae bacterium]|nr:aromatic ring-hydroxylating dioxygenase subunit alpha [Candidatus Baltobacteraceae bacterium]
MRTFVKASAPASARTLDAGWYLSPDVFSRERERIFARSWIGVGRAEQIADAGAFITAGIAGESLIVTRDARGVPHAFYNVCRHRGTRMCEQDAGVFKGSIQCPYHAWTYGLDGTLVAARNMESTPDFDRAQYSLREAQIAQFEGFLFVALDPEQPFAQAFEPLQGRFAAWEIGALRCAKRITYELACNWKLVFQNYSECYHCPVIHPQLERLSASESGRNDLIGGPFLGGYSTLRDERGSLTTTGHSSRAPLAGVRGEDLTRVYYYTIFPAMLLSLHPDYVMAHYVQPLEASRTRVTCEWFFDAAAMQEPGFDASDAVEFWDLTNRQDWHVNELTQLGIASRAYTPGPYSGQEGLLHAFDRHYLSLMQ